MNPAVVFADAERSQIDHLAAAFASRGEAYKPATVSDAFPTVALTGNTTHVQVDAEPADVSDYPVIERIPVRFTCYAGPTKRTNVKALASLAMALVASQLGGSGVAGAFIRTGRSEVIKDPDTGNLMCWFLAEIPLLATPLAP